MSRLLRLAIASLTVIQLLPDGQIGCARMSIATGAYTRIIYGEKAQAAIGNSKKM
jgi:hypothetical protein